MELHSYAKRRASKKWTIEQKRKLVEARISYDSWFDSKPSTSVLPWKKVLSVAKLDDFNAFFVRKQWSNMLAKYKQYKQTRLDGIGGINNTIDTEIIQRINQEWEFFEAIHTFMTRKTTNLHSYAVTQKFLNNNTPTTSTNDTNNGLTTNGTITTKNTSSTTSGIVNDDTLAAGTVEGNTLALALSRTLEPEGVKKSQHQLPKEREAATTVLIKLEQHRDCVKENIPNNSTVLVQFTGTAPRAEEENMQQQQQLHQQQHHLHHMFSSDTNEEFEGICGAETDTNDTTGCFQTRNTDHDFYSKSIAAEAAAAAAESVSLKIPEEERQLHYFADTSEESMGTEYVYQTTSSTSQNISLPSVMENIELHTEDGRTFEIKTENISTIPSVATSAVNRETLSLSELISCSSSGAKEHNGNNNKQPQMPATSLPPPPSSSFSSHANKMTERDKYYRHKRRFNRRLEKRFDAILHVMGQVVKSEYPCVNVQPLLDTIACTTSGISSLLSSESELEDDNDANDKRWNEPSSKDATK